MATLLCFLFTGVPVFSQNETISGRVTDINQQPLAEVNIMVKGSKHDGVRSDFDGRFVIAASVGDTLVFSFVNMETKKIRVTNSSGLEVTLTGIAASMDDVVVIGYGKQSRRTITTAISKVGAEKLEEVPVTSVITALQGKLSGVRIYQGQGGQPGSDAAIIVRGGSSINKSNDPLVLVDGMIRPLDDINPNDIESVQVLKDASSTAIYGSRASNGVVLVTTKRGSRGKAEIVVSTNSGFAQPWKLMDMGNAQEYITMTRTAINRSPYANMLTAQAPFGTGNGASSPWSLRILEHDENVPAGYHSMPDPVKPGQTLIFEDNDWQALTFNNHALELNHSITANGGTDKIRYAAGVSYSDIEGTAVGTKFKRFTGRSNVDFKLSQRLSLTTRMDHTNSATNNYDDASSVFNRSIWLAPTARVYLPDGTFASGQNATFTNVLWYNDVHQRETNVSRTGLGANLNWNILPGLEAEVKADYFLRNRTFESFEKANVYNSNRTAVFEYGQSRVFQLEGAVTYSKSFDNTHFFNVVGGVSEIKYKDMTATAEAQGASSDNIPTLNAGPLKTNATTSRTEDLLRGMFGRVTYDYRKKYLLAFSMRRDISSRFASGNRVGYFPGASLGWIVSEESFLRGNKTINTLKLRTSLGQTGNNSVGRYAYGGGYSVGNTYFGQPGSLPTDMANPTLRWETTTQWDMGFDLGLFKNDRVSVLFDYYNKITDDLLFNVPLPAESGYNSIDQNVGKVRFWGYEVEVKARILEGRNFRWNTDFNIGYTMNKVLKLPENGADRNRIGGIYDPATGRGIGGIAEGERMFSVLGYVSDYILDNWEQANNALYDANASGWSPVDNARVKGRKIPGDMEWKDMNNDGIINEYDQAVLGYLTPTTTGGITNQFFYKNFELSLFADFALGHSIADATIRRAYGNVVNGVYNILRESQTKTWTQEGDVAAGKAIMPRFDYLDQANQVNYQRNHDRAVYKGDYLCLREVRIGYNAPAYIAKLLRISSLRFTLSGQNLHYFTSYPGWATEFSSSANYDDNTYPVPRKIMLGIKIGF